MKLALFVAGGLSYFVGLVLSATEYGTASALMMIGGALTIIAVV